MNYQELYDQCELTTDPTRVLEMRVACKAMVDNQVTYWGVQKATGVPWLVVAGIHYRESSQSFKGHLHNGDPLTERTRHVPAGRPVQGNPPFTWSASAIDALSGRAVPFQWSVATALEYCERYNGMGYFKHGVNSPYLWSFTDQYLSGLFVADGTLDSARKDPRPGIAALYKQLEDYGVTLDFKTSVATDAVLH